MTEETYIGRELTLFACASNWKNYYTGIIRPYFGKKVLEVGAGLGASTSVMCDGTQDDWACLEPDPDLRAQIDLQIASGSLPPCCHTQGGLVNSLPAAAFFDTLIYVDVLEHIADDRGELFTAASHLLTGGVLIVLSPAHNFLYSLFDKSIGHYRRYNKTLLKDLTPSGMFTEKTIYLDSVGILTSLANRFFLRQSMPTLEQILFWDEKVLPLSRIIDPLIGFRTGRSIVVVWRKL